MILDAADSLLGIVCRIYLNMFWVLVFDCYKMLVKGVWAREARYPVLSFVLVPEARPWGWHWQDLYMLHL